MASTKNKDLESSFKKLTIDPSADPKVKAVKKTSAVADSWEDEASDEDDELGNETPTALSQTPCAPPPTPISPLSPQSTRLKTQQESQFISSLWESSNSIASPRGGAVENKRDKEDDKRPEKTDAVAKRMIAGALGIRAPKKTDEQKAYERAVREGEMTKRENERAEKKKLEEEREKAKRAIWES